MLLFRLPRSPGYSAEVVVGPFSATFMAGLDFPFRVLLLNFLFPFLRPFLCFVCCFDPPKVLAAAHLARSSGNANVNPVPFLPCPLVSLYLDASDFFRFLSRALSFLSYSS